MQRDSTMTAMVMLLPMLGSKVLAQVAQQLPRGR